MDNKSIIVADQNELKVTILGIILHKDMSGCSGGRVAAAIPDTLPRSLFGKTTSYRQNLYRKSQKV
jgi:hypothetical protein